jgi:hypothetical protein
MDSEQTITENHSTQLYPRPSQGRGLVGGSTAEKREQPIQARLSVMERLLNDLAGSLMALENRLSPITVIAPEFEADDKTTQASGSMVTETLDRYNSSIAYMRNRVEFLLSNIEV